MSYMAPISSVSRLMLGLVVVVTLCKKKEVVGLQKGRKVKVLLDRWKKVSLDNSCDNQKRVEVRKDINIKR